MDHTGLVTLLLFGLFCTASSCFLRQFHYVNLKMTWTEARHYCRLKYTDLATIESAEHISRLNRPALDTSEAWIGLWDDPDSWKGNMANDSNSWRWSATGQTSQTGYKVWSSGDPNNAGAKEHCAIMASNGAWYDLSCDERRSFVCYDGTAENWNTQSEETYVYIANQLSWSDAQAYCRQHHKDLPTVESGEENTAVFSKKPAYVDVWIGGYRVPWTWSDGSSGSFRNWNSEQPNNYHNQYCTAEDHLHEWNDLSCNMELTFLCHEDQKAKVTRVRLRIRTDADMTDAAISAQFLQQLDAHVKGQGRTDVALQLPNRAQKVRKPAEPRCIFQF